MKLYITVIEDRHIDTQVYAFSKLQDAIDCAVSWILHNKSGGEGYEKISGLEYWFQYNVEGDCVWVKQIELDEAVPYPVGE
jgi:hypothetical protein